MVALFQAVLNYYSFAPAMQTNNKTHTSKWVPINKSFISLSKLILRAAVDRLGLAHAAITLRAVNHDGYRHVLLVNDERELQLASLGRVEEFFISTQEANTSPFEDFMADAAYSVALNHTAPGGHLQRLGYLVVQAGPGMTLEQAQIDEELHQLAQEILNVISRYQTRYRALHLFEDTHFWVGNGEALRQLDQRMDLLAKGSQPVLIRGNKGSGKIIAARSLHCLSCKENAPFIESDCKDWAVGTAANVLLSLHTSANGGTLFLRNVNLLFSADFHALRDYWRKIASARYDGIHNIRLVLTLSRKDTALASYQSAWLSQQTQELVLPDLAERTDDKRDLAQFYLNQFSIGGNCDLTEEAWQLLENNDSVKNVDQLKALIQKICLVAEGNFISANELRTQMG